MLIAAPATPVGKLLEACAVKVSPAGAHRLPVRMGAC